MREGRKVMVRGEIPRRSCTRPMKQPRPSLIALTAKED